MASPAVARGDTIIGAATKIIRKNRGAMSPSEVAAAGLKSGALMVPRGRTKSYLNQLLQSSLYNNANYSPNPVVARTSRGSYRTRSR